MSRFAAGSWHLLMLTMYWTNLHQNKLAYLWISQQRLCHDNLFKWDCYTEYTPVSHWKSIVRRTRNFTVSSYKGHICQSRIRRLLSKKELLYRKSSIDLHPRGFRFTWNKPVHICEYHIIDDKHRLAISLGHCLHYGGDTAIMV